LSVLIVYLLSVENLNKKVAFALVLILLAVIIMPFIPEFMINRIDSAVETHADGRVDIWVAGLYALQKYWLIGAGLDNFPVVYTEFAEYSPYGMAFIGPHTIYSLDLS